MLLPEHTKHVKHLVNLLTKVWKGINCQLNTARGKYWNVVFNLAAVSVIAVLCFMQQKQFFFTCRNFLTNQPMWSLKWGKSKSECKWQLFAHSFFHWSIHHLWNILIVSHDDVESLSMRPSRHEGGTASEHGWGHLAPSWRSLHPPPPRATSHSEGVGAPLGQPRQQPLPHSVLIQSMCIDLGQCLFWWHQTFSSS